MTTDFDIGCDRPSKKFLYRHVISAIARKWYIVGLELLETTDETLLDNIRDQPSLDMEKCEKMLQLWLDKQPKASWNQLIAALKVDHVGLQTKSKEIEQMLILIGTDITSITNSYSY